MKRLANAPVLHSEDAATLANIMAEINTTNKELRTDMLARLKDIYIKNYYNVKNNKKNEKKNKSI